MPSNTSLNASFRKETIIAFGKRDSQLRMCVTTEADIQAESATFMVSDIEGQEMAKRGANGRIITHPPSDEQFKVVMEELLYKQAKNSYNIYTQQGKQFDLMKQNVVAIAETTQDKEIIKTLGDATRQANNGAAQALTSNALLKRILSAFGDLHTAGLPFFRIPAGAFADMHDIPQFGNRDFVQSDKFKGVPKSKAFEFFGINFIVMPDSYFEGNNSAKIAQAWVPEAVGHACDKKNAHFDFGYNAEDKYSWANSSIMTGSKIIQANGVIEVELDITANAVDPV